MPEYRVMTDELMGDYVAHWELGKVESWVRMTAGLANSNYKVVTSSGTFLLKICEEGRLDKIEHQLEALLQLQKFDYPTAYPHKLKNSNGLESTPHGLVNDYAMRSPKPLALLFDFLSGTTGTTYVSSESRMRSLGVATAKLSVVPAPEQFFASSPLHFPPAELIRDFLKNNGASSPHWTHPYVETYLRTRLPTLLGRVRNPRLPLAITHGDLFLDNCLWDDEKDVVSWVLDFEEVCFEPAILDVAMTILGCCFDKEKGELIESWTRAFLEGYYSVRPLTNLECELLPEMMDFCIIVASFWRFNQFYILHPELDMKDSYKELLDRIEKGDKGFSYFWRQNQETQKWKKETLDSYRQLRVRYCSTRGDPKAGDRTFKQALFAGFADDGGLLVPANLPRYTLQDIKSMHKQSYPTIVKRILAEFIPKSEMSSEDLERCVDEAFSSFADPKVVVPIVPLPSGKGDRKNKINIMEMFHGTTGAFKDLSMSIIGRLMQTLLDPSKTPKNNLSETNKETSDEKAKDGDSFKTIIVGTSGDTGSAAIHAVRACPSVDIVVLYPHGRVSRIQELQMVTEEKAHVFAVDGTSDDLDVPIKAVLSDKKFSQENNLCSINSINLARVAIQSAHFFYAYAQLMEDIEMFGKLPLVASIPCGACGDLVGALMAREMGLPLQLVASVNENDIVAKTLSSGTFATGDRQVFASTSPSMDIQVPYNWERVVYYASGGNVAAVKTFMEIFEKNPRQGAPMLPKWHAILQTFLHASSVSKDAVANITKLVYKSDNYILDPHTAVGVQGYLNLEDQVNPDGFFPVVILATATPHKFDESVKPTLGIDSLPNVPSVFLGLEQKKNIAKPMKLGTNWEQILREEVMAITASHAKK